MTSMNNFYGDGMSSSFFHLNQLAKQAPRRPAGADKLWSLKQALAEVMRVPGHCAHVQDPRAPVWHLGTPEDVKSAEARWRAQARQANGNRRLRIDSPSCAAGVLSLPRSQDGIWTDYREKVIDFFRERYQERVVGIAEHLDEDHFHLHIFLVPLDGEEFGAVHPGIAARRQARKEETNHVRLAFKRAMSLLQDEIWSATAKPFGLARFGEKRERWDRKTALMEKRIREAQEHSQANEQRARNAEEDLALARSEIAKLLNKNAALYHRSELIEQTAIEVIDQWKEHASSVEMALDDANEKIVKVQQKNSDLEINNLILKQSIIEVTARNPLSLSLSPGPDLKVSNQQVDSLISDAEYDEDTSYHEYDPTDYDVDR